MRTTLAHLCCEYLIPASHPEPAALGARLDSLAHDYLPGVCSSLLAHMLDSDDASIWLIRRLDVEVHLNVGSLDMATLAELWGRQIVRAILRALTPDQHLDSERVRHFPDYNAYLAHFISDLVAGRAWDQWYYDAFDSLRSLPPPIALRTVMLREPERIAPVLALLATQQRLEPVLHCLTVHDAHILYTAGYPVYAGEARMTTVQPNASVGTPLHESSVETPLLASDPSLLDNGEGRHEVAFRRQQWRPYEERAGTPLHESSVGTPLLASDPSPLPDEERHEVAFRRDEAHPYEERAGKPLHESSVRTPLMASEGDMGVSGSGTDGRHCIELVLSVWNRAALQLAGTHIATPHNALRLYTALWNQIVHTPIASSPDVREAIEQVLRFTELLHVSTQPDQLISCLLEQNLTAAIELLRREQGKALLPYLPSLSYLQQCAAGDIALLRRIVSTVATAKALSSKGSKSGKNDKGDNNSKGGRSGKSLDAVGEREEQHITSLLGGLFLLLPSFIDLKLPTLLENAPYSGVSETHRTSLLRYLVFLKCFGLLYKQWPDIAHDPLLLLVSHAEDMPLAPLLEQVSQVATPQMNATWQRSLLAQLVRYRLVEGRSLCAELLEPEASTFLLLRDMRSDAWLSLRAVTHETNALQAALVQGMTMLQDVFGFPAERLLLSAGLEQVSFPAALHADQPHITTANNDLRYLMLHSGTRPLIEQPDLDGTLSLFARTLLRSFARRLMGFDQSNAGYLYHNFLAGTSSVVLQPDHVEVQLPCSPLHLVLRIAGMHEQSYTLPWCGDMHVHVTVAC